MRKQYFTTLHCNTTIIITQSVGLCPSFLSWKNGTDLMASGDSNVIMSQVLDKFDLELDHEGDL